MDGLEYCTVWQLHKAFGLDKGNIWKYCPMWKKKKKVGGGEEKEIT
jgi:hypothetical protein